MRAHRRTGRGPRSVATALIVAATVLLPGAAALAADPDPIVGAWQATLDSAGDTVPAELLFTTDGTIVVTSPAGLDGAALGSWTRQGQDVLATIMAYAPGSDGVMVMDMTVTIASDGSLAATGTATLTAADGTPDTRTITGTATRITVHGPDTPPHPEARIATAAGAGPDAIAPTLAAFTAGFGQDNGGDPGSFGQGFRSITWDKVPADQSAPHTYAPDFFNGPAAPRARGLVFGGSADALMVSAGKGGDAGTLRFGGINASYLDSFQVFSADKLFSPVGTNVLQLSFFQPGTATPAVVKGFGAVFVDVDDAEATTIELFDAGGASLGVYPVQPANDGLSFLGLAFDDALIATARITLGTSPLGPTDGPAADVVVLDDLVYAEPQLIP